MEQGRMIYTLVPVNYDVDTDDIIEGYPLGANDEMERIRRVRRRSWEVVRPVFGYRTATHLIRVDDEWQYYIADVETGSE